MTTPSAIPHPTDPHAPARHGGTVQAPVLVWDAPVRVFHWLMVLCFAGAFVTAEAERWRLLHVSLGYTMAVLVAFRLMWGVVGSRTARFTEFVRGPRAVWTYAQAMLRGKPPAHAGHNPLGALAIVAMLLLTLLIAASGWAMVHGVAGGFMEELHEAVANTLLLVVLVHVAGVALTSWLHQTNLVRAMVTGYKAAVAAHAAAVEPDVPAAPNGAPGAAGNGQPAGQRLHPAQRPWRGVAALLLLAVCAFWVAQWRNPPLLAANTGTHPQATHDNDRDDSDGD